MASSLRGYLRRLRLFNLAAPIVVDAVLRLGAMDHGCAPSLSQQWVDADQVGVEGHVADFGRRQVMRDHRLF